MSSPVSNDHTSMWSYMTHLGAPPAAAAVAILPAYYGFVAKSALQKGGLVPKITWKEMFRDGARIPHTISLKEVVKGGVEAAPIIGTIVGLQMLVQGYVEKEMRTLFPGEGPQAEFASKFFSSMVVGGISAPALAAFNGKTMAKPVPIAQSLRALTPKQVAAIVGREGSFIFSLGVSEPLSHWMRESVGESRVVDYSSAFASGVLGSVVGHPLDTALTLWQNQLKVQGLRQLYAGGLHKAVAVGVFSTVYTLVKGRLQE